MSHLIPFKQTFIAGISTRTVSARKLHAFLGVKRVFSSWIKGRIEQYNFEENQDFIILHPNGCKIGRGRPNANYYLTIDMAKELAMVERNEKGKQARRYFIDCEKKLVEKTKQGVSAKNHMNHLKTLLEPPEAINWPIEKPDQRLLIIIKKGESSIYPIPDNALIISPSEIYKGIDGYLPGYTLIKKQDLLAIHRSFSNLKSALKKSEQAWQSSEKITGINGLAV